MSQNRLSKDESLTWREKKGEISHQWKCQGCFFHRVGILSKLSQVRRKIRQTERLAHLQQKEDSPNQNKSKKFFHAIRCGCEVWLTKNFAWWPWEGNVTRIDMFYFLINCNLHLLVIYSLWARFDPVKKKTLMSR